jgi:hypothetical protein
VKSFYKTVLSLIFISTFSTAVLAEGRFYFNSNSVSNVYVGDIIDVVVNIDSGESDIVKAVVVLQYDPYVLELDQDNVIVNSDLFCDYPSDQQLLDPDTGMVKITGECSTDPYRSAGTASDGVGDSMVVFKFKVLQSQDTAITWAYTGNDDGSSSVILENQSPPQNVLLHQPASLNITNSSASSTPNTGIFDNTTYIIALSLGVFGMIIGFIVYRNVYSEFDKKTVVLLNDK